MVEMTLPGKAAASPEPTANREPDASAAPAAAPAKTIDDILGPKLPSNGPITDKPLTIDGILGPRPEDQSLLDLAHMDIPPINHAGLLERIQRSIDPVDILKAAKDSAVEGFGTDKIGLSDEHVKWLRDHGVISDPETGLAGPLRNLNEALIAPAAQLGDVAMRSITALVTGVAGGIGHAVGAATDNETEGAKAKTEMINLANMLMLESGTPISRVEMGRMGKPVDTALGKIPIAEDFSDAAAVLGKPGAEPVIRQLYEEHGVLPAELVHDAAHDPTIAQDILAGKLPSAYTGKTGPQAETAVDFWKQYDSLIVEGKTDEAIKLGDKLLADEAKAEKEADTKAAEDAASKDLVPADAKPGEVAVADGSSKDLTTGSTDGSSKDLTTGSTDVVSRDTQAGGSGGGSEPPLLNHTIDHEPGKDPAAPDEPAYTLDQANKIIDSQIVVGASETKRPITWERIYTAIVDDLNPVREAVKAALAKLKAKIPVSEDAYSLFRLTRGTFGKADQMLLNSTFNFKSYANNGAGLKAILGSLGEDLGQFRRYIASKRAIELEARGMDSGMDTYAARVIVQDGKGKYEATHRALVDYQNRLSMYLRDAGLLTRNAYQAMIKANRDYVPFFRYFSPEDSLLGKGVGPTTGGKKLASRNPIKGIEGSELAVIDPIESVIKNTYTYIHLAEKNAAGLKLVDLLKRADEGAKMRVSMLPHGVETPGKPSTAVATTGGTGVKVAEGEVLPPEGSTQSKWITAEGKAVGKPASREVGPVLEKVEGKGTTDANFQMLMESHGVTDEDLTALIQNASREPEGGIITVYRDGIREQYKVNDPELLASWRGLDQWSADLITKVLAVPARVLRAGVTLTPDFLVRNAIGDFFSAVVNSKGALFSPLQTVRGAVSLVSKDVDYQSWLKSGGANATLTSLDRRYVQENLLKLGAETKFMDGVRNVVTSPLRGLQLTSALIENATRLGEFKKQVGAATDKASIQAAGMASREVTLDFARIGAQLRGYNMITAFANANIQGVDRLARTFKEDFFGTSVKIAGGIMAPTALLWFANHEDGRYKDLPDWQKDLYWIILTDKWEPAQNGQEQGLPAYLVRQKNGKTEVNNGNIFRLRKPLETGIIFGAGLERTLSAFYDHNPRAYKNFVASMSAALLPSIIPTAVLPAFEQWANKSNVAGDNLIPASLEKQVPEYQYTQYTTETAKALGRVISAFPGMRDAATDKSNFINPLASTLTSPILIENYVRDWTGGVGQYVLNTLDLSLRKGGVIPDPPQAAKTLADVPFVKAFVVRYPSASAQSIQDFWDASEQNAMVMSSMKAQAKVGDVDAAQRIVDLYGPRMVLDGMQKTISELTMSIHMVNADPKMSAQDKRQLIDGMYYSMAEIAKNGNEILDQAKQVLARPSVK